MSAYHYRGQADRRYLDWHYTLDDDMTLIDLDAVEVCKTCRETLMLCETSRDATKRTTILARLAERAKIPAWLIIVPEGDLLPDVVVRVRRVFPFDDSPLLPISGFYELTLNGWAQHLRNIRDRHDAMEHR